MNGAVSYAGNVVNLSREATQALSNELRTAMSPRQCGSTQVALMSMAVTVVQQLGDEVEALRRQQEIVADVSWVVGYHWRVVDEPVRMEVMDAIDGSRGLMAKCVEWAKEFDHVWEAKDVDKREDYIVEVDHFASSKFKALVAEIRLGA